MTVPPPRAAALAGLLLFAPATPSAGEQGWPSLADVPPRPDAMASAEEMARLAERLAALGDEARRRAALLRAADRPDDGR